jgi:hypothetical protein
MSILNREEFFNRIQERLGDDTSDEAITFIEDVTDTYNDFESKVSEDWKTKYSELDEAWKKRYRDRFFGKPDGDGEDHEVTPQEALESQIENVSDDGEVRSFEELFEEREG